MYQVWTHLKWIVTPQGLLGVDVYLACPLFTWYVNNSRLEYIKYIRIFSDFQIAWYIGNMAY